jgi:hypothetical protein
LPSATVSELTSATRASIPGPAPDMMTKVQSIPRPVVAAVQGIATAAALAARLPDQTTFAILRVYPMAISGLKMHSPNPDS